MDRRSFMKFFGLTTAVVAIPVTTAVAVSKKTKIPPMSPPVPNKKPKVSNGYLNIEPLDHPEFVLGGNEFKCAMTVGRDGCLWVKPQDSNEWFRLAMETVKDVV